MIKIEDMRTGDWVRWDSKDWQVTDRDTFRESADYSETQWELEPETGATHYLVRSRENKPGGVEEVWVCTRQTGVGTVQYQVKPGVWRSFREKDSLAEAPPVVKSGSIEFALDGKSEARAEDDDGNTVDKLTWDYYDPDRQKNLAIEIWKEPDADYYEAYDGRVVRPSDFAPLPPRAATRRGRKGEDTVSFLIVACFACMFVVPIAGGMMTAFDVGAEYILALLLPMAFAYGCYIKGVHTSVLYTSLSASLAAVIFLLNVRGLGASYWEYAFYGLLVGPAVTEAAARLFGGVRPYDKTAAASTSTFLVMFIVSFAHYISAAPRPHNASGLWAACVLPLLPVLAVFLLYALKGGSNEQA